MTVLDNVLVGAHTRTKPFRSGTVRKNAAEVLEYVGIADVANRPAAGLPFGRLKGCERARGRVAQPRWRLLGERAGGLNHEEVAELGTFIRKLREDFDLTV